MGKFDQLIRCLLGVSAILVSKDLINNDVVMGWTSSALKTYSYVNELLVRKSRLSGAYLYGQAGRNSIRGLP